MKKRILLLLAIIPILGFSQTEEERREIVSHSNKVANAKLSSELKNQEEQRLLRLNAYLQSHPEVNKIVYNDERGKKELMDVLPNGEFIYAQTDNAGAAITARANRLYSGGTLGLNIQGQNMTAAVWDGDNVRSTHQEFMVNGISKVQNLDGTTTGGHATHVAGTIAAQGTNPNARGIAFNASVKSYNWTNDLSEMQIEAFTGLLMSNHSYGMGQLGSIWFFGAYDSRASQVDEICFANPYYLPTFSAGNSRNETTPPASTQITNKGGYDLIFGHANAKNILTVAAVYEVPNYIDASSVTMSTFSSWGPSDDGRIKPDISMKGVQVFSSYNNSDTSYASLQGTSMASPGVTGVVTLLQQYYNQLYANFMKAATVKGLILHTADEAGFFTGPDYEYGWGLINAEKAANVITNKNATTNPSIIEENNLTNNTSYTKTISSTGSVPLQVSISWTDPANTNYNVGTTDPSVAYLVNDLDLKVTSSDGTIYYPWKLQGMSSAFSPASNNSTNDVDNFERVDINNPSGTYTISVTHKGSLINANQNYSLIVSGANIASLGVNEIGSNNKETGVMLYPVPANDVLHIDSQEKLKSNISIIDLSGRVVLNCTLDNDKINIENLNTGVYIFVAEKLNGDKVNIKFTKK